MCLFNEPVADQLWWRENVEKEGQQKSVPFFIYLFFWFLFLLMFNLFIFSGMSHKHTSSVSHSFSLIGDELKDAP